MSGQVQEVIPGDYYANIEEIGEWLERELMDAAGPELSLERKEAMRDMMAEVLDMLDDASQRARRAETAVDILENTLKSAYYRLEKQDRALDLCVQKAEEAADTDQEMKKSGSSTGNKP